MVILIILLLVLPKLLPESQKVELLEDSLYKVEVEEFIKSYSQRNPNTLHNEDETQSRFSHTTKGSRYSPYPFDPNTASNEDYMKMGFSERQAAVMVKYRDKGGRFFQKEDFNKLYIIDDETYKIFEPYIRISNELRPNDNLYQENLNDRFNNNISHQSTVASKPMKKVMVEVNSADSLDLLSVMGIGPVFASRIMKYRKRLGGFYDINQLKEVYGIDSSRFEGIKNQIFVDSLKIEKIDLNTVTLEQLRKHPYFDYTTAKAVIDKRIQSKGLRSLAEIRPILDKKGKFEILKHYLKLN